MAKVLYITANPKAEEHSFGMAVGRAFLNAYKEAHPQDEVVELDLYKANIPAIDEEVMGGWGKLASGSEFQHLSAGEQAKVARLGELADQFVSADKYVFVTPMWNLLFPPVLKAYIDSFMVAGKTFKYTENGPQGLLGGKKVMHIEAAGGIYSAGPAEGLNFSDKYLRAVLNFIGMTDIETLLVEGMAYTPDKADEIKANAIEKATGLGRNF